MQATDKWLLKCSIPVKSFHLDNYKGIKRTYARGGNNGFRIFFVCLFVKLHIVESQWLIQRPTVVLLTEDTVYVCVCMCVCTRAYNGPSIKPIVCSINPKEMTFTFLRHRLPRLNKLPFSSTAWQLQSTFGLKIRQDSRFQLWYRGISKQTRSQQGQSSFKT